MIDYIKGTVTEITPTEIVVECYGIGYSILISLQTYEQLNGKKDVVVYIHHYIREDEELYYGFASKDERELFRLLISVSGIGASTARMMLSSLETDELIRAVVKEDIATIKSIKGIGLKTAQRLIIELKDSLSKFEISETGVPNNNKNREEALLALQTLGFNKLLIEKTLDKILNNDSDYGVEDLIRLALKVL